MLLGDETREPCMGHLDDARDPWSPCDAAERAERNRMEYFRGISAAAAAAASNAAADTASVTEGCTNAPGGGRGGGGRAKRPRTSTSNLGPESNTVARNFRPMGGTVRWTPEGQRTWETEGLCSTTSSLSPGNRLKNGLMMLSEIDPHPNISRCFCHFEDSIPQEFYDSILVIQEEKPERQSKFDWFVVEHQTETLGNLLRRNFPSKINTPWCIVHKYSRDISAALVHLFTHHVIHFGLSLDTIAVTANKEQAILVDLLDCSFLSATNSKLLRMSEVSQVVLPENESRTAPEILNGISSSYSATLATNGDTTLDCEKQSSFELGCALFELAMCGQQHPVPGYPKSFRGTDGLIPLSQQSEKEASFPIKPPAFPKEFCNLVRGLLQFDPTKRPTLLEAHRTLMTIESPSPLELLSFYSNALPTYNAGSLTMKAMCQLHSEFPIDECVSTLRDALQCTPSFPPALLLLHCLSSTSIITPVLLDKNERRETTRVLTGRGLVTATSVEFKRAIINWQQHTSTPPELMMMALWTRYMCSDGRCRSKQQPLQLSLAQQQLFSSSIVLKLWANLCATTLYEQMWSDKISACLYGCNPRNEMMMKALLEWECGNTTSAINYVMQAYVHFNSESLSEDEESYQQHYLPGLIFLYGLGRLTTDCEQLALHQIPKYLSSALSRASSSTFSKLRDFCSGVLAFNKKNKAVAMGKSSDPIIDEWNDLLSAVAAKVFHVQASNRRKSEVEVAVEDKDIVRGGWCGCGTNETGLNEDLLINLLESEINIDSNSNTINPCMSWSCAFFVALWMVCCLRDCGISIVTRLSKLTWTTATSLTASRCGKSPQPPPLLKPAYVSLLGLCYYSGSTGVPKDLTKTVSLWESAVSDGDAVAMYNLGCLYQGKGVCRDPKKAASLYQQAIDCRKIPRAMYLLAICYAGGHGVPKDLGKAVALFRRAAASGESSAISYTAEWYIRGYHGVEKDVSRAGKLYKRAAESGNLRALCDLAVCYDNGEGVPRDPQRALALYQRAADQGDTQAMSYLANIYGLGSRGVARDPRRGAELYQRAADRGSALGMYNLAMCYKTGQGVERPDPGRAAGLSFRAAERGNAAAMNFLGACYESGEGVCRDIRAAVQWYRMAAHSKSGGGRRSLEAVLGRFSDSAAPGDDDADDSSSSDSSSSSSSESSSSSSPVSSASDSSIPDSSNASELESE
ncbi:SEL1 protein [Pelomyxa schiedti]|nr:SEL1 protein [Pelomyxa schiedti]